MALSIHRDQRGFAALEVILLVAVLGILGYVGYRYYQSQQTKPTSQTTQQTAENSKSKTICSKPAGSATGFPAGWVQYSALKDTGYDITFAYPKEWRFKLEPAKVKDASGKEYEGNILTLKTDDFSQTTFQGGRRNVNSGMETVLTANANIDKSTVDEVDLAGAAKAFGGTYGRFTEGGGCDGYWAEPASGGEAVGYDVAIYTDKLVYNFGLYLANDAAVKAFKPTLSQFIKTIQVGKLSTKQGD